MDAMEFRSLMMEKVRGFDRWAYKDARDNPDEYADFDFDAWYSLFLTYMENAE